MMKTKMMILSLLICSLNTIAQRSKSSKQVIDVSLKADNWEFKPNTVEFLQYKSLPAMKLLSGEDEVVLKGLDFSDGIIEYDMEPLDANFTSVFFRQLNPQERECFYFRTANAGNSQALDAIQYAPFISGVNLWDMFFHFQGNASFERSKWNHVKLVISGKQLRVYVNDTAHSVLNVPQMEGNTQHGSIAFRGKVIIANLVVKPGQTEGLSPLAGIDPTDNDPRYLRKWQISPALIIPEKIEFSYTLMPTAETAWDTIWAERRGLINITRKFGKSEVRRLVWLKTNIHCLKAQNRKLNLGFSDDVWVFINGRYLYVDKNPYGTPGAKAPDGRCSIENTAFNVPLKEGDNELLIGVANDFYGWGIVARLDN
jgi:hypothetical protein